MHQKYAQSVDSANVSDNVGINIKGLDKQNIPLSGDVIVYQKDTTPYNNDRYDEFPRVMKSMLIEVGWTNDLIEAILMSVFEPTAMNVKCGCEP